ncbi:MAG: peptidoglycan DD-metalloendopeptidase family protein [Roseburia sp.]|nr:peptidoglycan DD-metalloendopeptidase family protein [Ruminococcus sp.]MCM1156728.1 peptidoglycan DD-metalloendopeptidase family protein [Roseburia sp.]MCM1241380.1 peptidoglycan DD-metalloendopeptidase family protein [Roseburia sp.]
MKIWKKVVCFMACIGIVFVFPVGTAEAVTNDSIREKEAEIATAKEEVANLKSNLTDVEALKKELEQSKNDLTAYVTQLDTQLSDIQSKIDEYNDLIAIKESEIETTTAELNDAITRQEEQYEAMKLRIQFMYEQGDTLYMEILFSSDNIADTINKADYIEALSTYDRNQLDEYVKTSEMIALCKEELEAEKVVLDEARLAVEAEEAAVSTMIAEKESQIVSVSSDISTKEAAIKAYEDMIAAENAEIAALEKAVAEEKARLAAANANARVYDGGMFAFPCPGYKRISDDYGNRIHPTLGVEKFHNGIDLAAPYGTAILAAYDGDVVAADYSSSMGNYIMINHGDGLYTIYMHASALYVSKGQSVYKGQAIAAVGSTGRSTGNHLHFSVRLNGNYVSPWNYLK